MDRVIAIAFAIAFAFAIAIVNDIIDCGYETFLFTRSIPCCL